jgi:hypothetical protein
MLVIIIQASVSYWLLMLKYSFLMNEIRAYADSYFYIVVEIIVL